MYMLLVGTNFFFNFAIKRYASPFGYPTVTDLVRRTAAFFLIISFCGHAIPKLFAIIALYSALLWSMLLSIAPSSLLCGKPRIIPQRLGKLFYASKWHYYPLPDDVLGPIPLLDSVTPRLLVVLVSWLIFLFLFFVSLFPLVLLDWFLLFRGFFPCIWSFPLQDYNVEIIRILFEDS